MLASRALPRLEKPHKLSRPVAIMVKVSFIKTLWGVTEAMGNSPGGTLISNSQPSFSPLFTPRAGYDALFARIKAEGFDGIETPVSLVDDAAAFTAALRKHSMSYVAMINTCVARFLNFLALP